MGIVEGYGVLMVDTRCLLAVHYPCTRCISHEYVRIVVQRLSHIISASDDVTRCNSIPQARQRVQITARS